MSTMAKQGMSDTRWPKTQGVWVRPPMGKAPLEKTFLWTFLWCRYVPSRWPHNQASPDTIVQPGKNVWDNFVSTSRAQKTPTKVKTLGRNHQENPAPTTRWRHSLVCEFHKTRKCTKPRPLIVKTQGNNVRHPKTCLVHHAVVTKTDLSHQRKKKYSRLRANVQGRTALPPECTPAQCGPRSL